MQIDVREAVRVAKEHAALVFANEGGSDPSLEEVWYDDAERRWYVTVGIRHREMPQSTLTVFGPTAKQVDYKTVEISADGQPLAIRNYSTAA